jgi:DNA invertase Pin-like site-specific DNA recombinase
LIELKRTSRLGARVVTINAELLHFHSTPPRIGKAMFQMLGVFAEFERGIIRERVNAGLARARQRA